MLRTRLLLLSALAVALISTAVLLISYNNTSQSLARAQDGNDISRKNIVGGHTPGYSILETSGDVLDPISLNVTIKDAVVDPMKYLREFNYGRVSELPNGTDVKGVHSSCV